MWRDRDRCLTLAAQLGDIFSIDESVTPNGGFLRSFVSQFCKVACHRSSNAARTWTMRLWGWMIATLLLGSLNEARAELVRPPLARPEPLPVTRWTHQKDHAIWDRAALSALKTHGAPLVEIVPRDVSDWCPAYRYADEPKRRAFWVGFLSALAKHESTYRQTAVGGGGKWYGLLQILPATARGYGCTARTGAALKDGAANLSCAIRIMAVTVPRDGVIYAPGGRGVAADWGPMRSRKKRADMVGYTRNLPACQIATVPRPRLRPARLDVAAVGD